MYDYGYSTDYSSSVASGLLAGLAAGLMIFFIILLAVCVFIIVAEWKVFKKAGRNGWEAIIPFYNVYVLYEISGYPGWYMFLAFIPFAGTIITLVFQIMACMSLAKKFGKSDAFGVCTVFFPFVCMPILGFGSATYDDSLGEHKNTTSNTNTNSNNNVVQEKVKYCPNCGEKLSEKDTVCSKCNAEL